ncbi:MAG: redoxin family protein [Cephaloticoccus sp.]|nr:redoxin family protein [Cephaloticoccus sp.]
MKIRYLLAFTVGLAIALGQTATAADSPNPAADSPEAGINAIDARLAAKIKAGMEAPSDFAEEAAAYDELLAKFAGDKSDAVANIAFEQAYFTFQYLEDDATAARQAEALKANFPATPTAAKADKLLALIVRVQEGRIKQAGLIGQQAPEVHFKWSNHNDLTTLSALKGQVVVLDFWATWCGPCIRSFPTTRKLTAQFAGLPVTIIGVTSIQGRVSNMGPRIDTKGDPEKEMSLMPEFIKMHDMTWNIAFSDEEVFNPDYAVTGIPYLAIIAPDGTVRHTGIHPDDTKADIPGKITALLKEFNLPASL